MNIYEQLKNFRVSCGFLHNGGDIIMFIATSDKNTKELISNIIISPEGFYESPTGPKPFIGLDEFITHINECIINIDKDNPIGLYLDRIKERK